MANSETVNLTSSEPALGSREERRAFFRQAARITAPIALENFMDAAVSTADVLMLSFVSQAALASSSLASQVAFIMANLLYGVSSAAAVLVAQYWGKGDRTAVKRVAGLALRVALCIGAVFMLLGLLMPDVLMRIYTNDPELIREGQKYLRTVSVSYLFGAMSTVYLAVMRSVERVKLSAAVHCSAVGMNVLLNACFIFGWGFFPKLGVVGVALATSITRVLEFTVCVIDSRLNHTVRVGLRDLTAKVGALMRDFFRIAVPAAANDVIWGLAFSVYSVILGHLSSDIVAANSVANVVRNLGTVVCFGIAGSGAIMLGKAMGDNRLEQACVWAKRFARMSVILALIAGGLILLCRPLVLRFMGVYVPVTDRVREELSIMLYINSYYILGMSFNTMLICGIFRAGGDVRYGLICDTVTMWGFSVPIGLLCAFVLKLPEMWVYFILCLDEFVKMPFNIRHYRKQQWLNNLTRDQIA